MDAKVKQAMVIEDEATVQSVLTAFLRRYFQERGESCEVKSYDDPVQGLFDLTTQGDRYDLVLLDVRMPRLNGDDIYESMQHVLPEVLNRILFVTAYPEDLEARFPNLNLRVLPKPFRYEDFAAKLDEMLGAA